MDDNYLSDVYLVFKTLTDEELFSEYFSESLGEPYQTPEARLATEKIFIERGISIADANEIYISSLQNFKSRPPLEVEKNCFPSIAVIGTTWFYSQWQNSLQTHANYGWNSDNIQSIISYYDFRSTPLSDDDRASLEKSEDEFWTAVHYGKYKSQKK